MGITFRQDVAAVPHPSNASTRKYGQSLVLQQQQQKYAAQQAGYDRMFQVGRDNMQNRFQADRDRRQNEFVMGRDKTQFEQEQQLAEAKRQQEFLDEARKQSSGFITDAIAKGEYDPVTARKLQQNLVAEAEALGNPQLDATQRAEVLQKIRAERALLAANRMTPPPKPTRDDELKQFLGGNYDKYKDQPWVPDGKGGFTIADIPQPPPAPPAPPKSAQEYYNANEDKFQKDLDATMGAMQDAYDLDPKNPKPTPQAAWEQMQKDYQFRMQALGRNAQPSAAPAGQPFQLPSDRMAPAMGEVDPMTGQAVQSGSMSSPPTSGKAPPPAWWSSMDPNDTNARRGLAPSPEQTSLPAQNSWADVIEPMQPVPSPMLTRADPGHWSNLSGAMQQEAASDRVASVARKDGRTTYLNPDGSTTLGPLPESPADNRRVATIDRKDGRTTYLNPDGTTSLGPVPKEGPGSDRTLVLEQSRGEIQKATKPNFTALAKQATDEIDRTIVGKLQEAYESQSPEIQDAINVFLDPDSLAEDAGLAMAKLRAAGIDIEQLASPPEAQYRGSGRGQTQTSKSNNSSARYGSGRGGARTK